MSRKDCRSLPGRGGAALRLRVLLAHFAPGIRRSPALSLSLGAGHPQACSSIIWAPGPGFSAADRLVILSPLLHLGLSTSLETEGWGRGVLLQAGKGARSVEATGPGAWQERPGTPCGKHAVLVGRGGSAGSRPTPRVPAGFPLHVGVGVGVGTEAETRPDLKAESVSPAFLSLRLRLARPGVAFPGERRFTGHQEPSCPRGPSALPGVRPLPAGCFSDGPRWLSVSSVPLGLRSGLPGGPWCRLPGWPRAPSCPQSTALGLSALIPLPARLEPALPVCSQRRERRQTLGVGVLHAFQQTL